MWAFLLACVLHVRLRFGHRGQHAGGDRAAGRDGRFRAGKLRRCRWRRLAGGDADPDGRTLGRAPCRGRRQPGHRPRWRQLSQGDGYLLRFRPLPFRLCQWVQSPKSPKSMSAMLTADGSQADESREETQQARLGTAKIHSTASRAALGVIRHGMHTVRAERIGMNEANISFCPVEPLLPERSIFFAAQSEEFGPRSNR